MISKAVIKNLKKVNIDEIMFYLKSRYSADGRDQINFIQGIPNQGDIPSFEAVSENLKTISKSMKEDENTSLKNKFLFGEWISIASKPCRHYKITKKKNLSHRF